MLCASCVRAAANKVSHNELLQTNYVSAARLQARQQRTAHRKLLDSHGRHKLDVAHNQGRAHVAGAIALYPAVLRERHAVQVLAKVLNLCSLMGEQVARLRDQSQWNELLPSRSHLQCI
jgi:hypothetical protein